MMELLNVVMNKSLDIKSKLKGYSFNTYLIWVVFQVSLVPIIYCSFFNYATGDDLWEGSSLRRVIVGGGSLHDAWIAFSDRFRMDYFGWEGNWSSIILWCIEPSIWGERFYTISTYIALAAILGGVGYLLSYLVKEYELLDKNSAAFIYFSFLFVSIQYIPHGNTALFWYAVIVNYILPFGLLLVAIVYADKFLHGYGNRYLIYLTLIVIYISGAGYMTVILAFEVMVLFIIYSLLVRNKRGLYIFIPLIGWLIGTLVSVLAPGNEVRGGGEFDFSVLNVFLCIVKSILNGTGGIPKYFLYSRMLFIYYPLVIWAVWKYLDIDKCRWSFKNPLGVGIILYLLYCSSYAPEIFSASATSSGVTNTYWLVFMVLSTFGAVYVVGYIKRRWLYQDIKWLSIYTKICLLLVIAMVILGRHFIGNMFGYRTMQFIMDGRLEDYRTQMEERLELLNDPNVSDVIVPMMNLDQGPFMHFALIEDPNEYTNYATAAFYGKNTVVAVPREEFEAIKNEQ